MTLKIQAVEAGQNHATTLVFLHGGGGAGWMWQPQVAALAERYHCLVPDLPEHGNSRATGPFTMNGAAESVADLIARRAHDGRTHVIGLSLGAQVTVALLASAPERLMSAIVSSALLRSLPGSGLMTPGVLRWTYRLSTGPLRNSAWYARLNMKRVAGVPEAYFPQFFDEFRHITADTFAHIMTANMQFRLPAGLDRAKLPVLVVVGKKEYGVMQESARDLVVALPDARGVIIDAGRTLAENHNWNMHAPDLFNRMVQAWVDKTPLPDELKLL